MNMTDLQEIIDEIERRKKSKIAVDGEAVVAEMAIMDSWRGVVQDDAKEVDFFDCTESDAHRSYIDRMCGRESPPARLNNDAEDTHAGYIRRMTTGAPKQAAKVGWLK